MFGGRKTAVPRDERQVRNLARGLFWVSAALLMACMTMTALFGWSLGTSWVNKAVFALGLASADVAGALLMNTSGACSANSEANASRGAFAVAVVCFCLTLFGVVGFQSENREATVQARERASNVSAAYLDWSKTAVTDAADKKGKGQPQAILSGIQAVGDQVKDQIRMLQSGELPAMADGQATTIARITGLKEADARSYSTAGGSVALLLIQYACLWFYGFVRQKIEPQIIARNSVGMSRMPQNADGKPAKPLIFSDFDAREDLDRLLATGYHIDNISFLARRWGWSPNRAGRWLRSQPDLKVLPPGRRGQRKSVELATPHINGNGRALVS